VRGNQHENFLFKYLALHIAVANQSNPGPDGVLEKDKTPRTFLQDALNIPRMGRRL